MSDIFTVGENHYIRTKVSGMDGRTQVGWAEEGSDFEVRANPEGVWFKGSMKNKVSTSGELQDFAELVSEAYLEHQRLKPKLALTPDKKEGLSL